MGHPVGWPSSLVQKARNLCESIVAARLSLHEIYARLREPKKKRTSKIKLVFCWQAVGEVKPENKNPSLTRLYAKTDTIHGIITKKNRIDGGGRGGIKLNGIDASGGHITNVQRKLGKYMFFVTYGNSFSQR